MSRCYSTTFEEEISSSNVVPAGRISTYHSLHIQYLQRSSWGWTVTVRNMYSWYLSTNKHLTSATTLCISLDCIYIAKNDTRTFQCQVTDEVCHILGYDALRFYVYCRYYWTNLKMEAASSSETLALMYQSIRHNNLEYLTLRYLIHHRHHHPSIHISPELGCIIEVTFCSSPSSNKRPFCICFSVSLLTPWNRMQ